jgi:hypothetical protein
MHWTKVNNTLSNILSTPAFSAKKKDKRLRTVLAAFHAWFLFYGTNIGP